MSMHARPVNPPIILLVAVLACVSLGAAPQQASPEANVVERPFPSGGTVSLDLSAGAYIVRGTADEAIRVRWDTRSPSDASRVQAEVVTEGSTASIRTRGPKDGFRVEIDLPQRSDLHLSLSAGDLRIRGLEGNKTVSMWAGDVLIEVGPAEQYKQVEASVRVGDLTMPAFGLGNTGGLFRSRTWSGPGRYTIKATLTAGDLKLVR
jgi:hypothetical protein